MSFSTPISLSNPKFDEIAGRVHHSFPNSCILWIDEIHNPELEKDHETLFENIKKYERKKLKNENYSTEQLKLLQN